jgi:glutaminyl-tRNA synthetase
MNLWSQAKEMSDSHTAPTGDIPNDFIRSIVAEDQASGAYDGRVVTRFPPEPNGYLHIGHAKSICLNFGVGEQYPGARCHMRFDDTNPTREDIEYVESILADVKWLGFDWDEHLYYASDYFEQLYEYAEQLILDGNAYVDGLTADEIREHRGTLTEPGRESPDRNRLTEENRDLFRRMRAGEFGDGEYVLRAKIDMASPNLNMRDPVLYRIRHAEHHRTGDDWCIYPMYDYAHSLSDSIEGITHSLCTLEFEDHRPLYDWCQEALGIYRSRQIEFARLNLTHTVMSKRMLRRLVEDEHVVGWDDPRMPTISALRRRGYTPEAIRDMCERVGVARRNTVTELALLEHCLREDLNQRAPRRMAVLDPLKVVITNYPEGESEEFEAVNNPEDDSMGTRSVPFSREIFIERDDFMEDPPRRFYRLAPGREVRLRYACLITCTGVVKDADGNVEEVHCEYDPQSRGGNAPDGRRVQGTIHWVSAGHAEQVEVRLYDNLFTDPDPVGAASGSGDDFVDLINPDSLEVVTAVAEPALASVQPGDRYQFERLGYFCVDLDSEVGKPVFNRTTTLRDSWARISQRQG